MSDIEAAKPRHLHPVRTPHPEAEAAQRQAAEEKAARKSRKPKGAVVEDRAIPEFTKPEDAVRAVVKTSQAVHRAEAKAAELGKEIGQKTKKLREALIAAVDGIEGKSGQADAVREAFAKIAAAEERRKSAAGAAKKGREEAAEVVEAIENQASESLLRVRKAWRALEKHKNESAVERAAARESVTEARGKRDAVLDGARQLTLAL